MLEKIMNNFDYLTDRLPIDKHGLDEEFLQQPVLFQIVTDQLAEYIHQRDSQKLKLEEIYADLSNNIRYQAQTSNIKFTEDQIKQTIIANRKYKDASIAYLEIKKITDKWIGLKEAYSQRGFALRDLAELWRYGYFSSNSSPTNAPAGTARYDELRRESAHLRLKQSES